MNNHLSFLYKQIKENQISREDAIKEMKAFKAKHTQRRESAGSENHSSMVGGDGASLFNRISIKEDVLQEKAIGYFKKLLSGVIKLPPNRIEEDTPMEKYGIDSIMVMQLTNVLEMTFGSLPKTLFFEYENIRQITGYFLEFYREQLIGLLGVQDNIPIIENLSEAAFRGTGKPAAEIYKKTRFVSVAAGVQQEKRTDVLDIAIIGVAGRYPGAQDIREFWKNLRDGKDCITEIPKERWDYSLYFDEDKNKFGKTYSKWGGFLEGVDQFDPLFFNISPREAQFMDPQERIFLECAFETLEDAGYTRQALSLQDNVGVYVGVMYEEYQLYGAQKQFQGRNIALAGNPSSIANRVSYFCNFRGPSIAIDTMCSSSLTAIHLACQSLKQGECELAIAGGVNVSIHPNKYLMLAQGKMLSSKGRCQSFGQGGDGYVPGEGAGAILLKPLPQAVADNDHIYGIIKGTAINHGGKSNGYTVPNPNAQASLIGRVLAKSGIHPRTISYLEAQATGTSLGDPIEIAGLSKAFQEYTKDKQFCAIGTVKSNIGHCESASGIAGVTKVLLQLKHQQLVPSLHASPLTPNIDFGNTPFFVQQETAEWRRPVIDGQEVARRAGISAFGAGGSNAHLIIEEYVAKELKNTYTVTDFLEPVLIPLSAKNRKQLKELVQRLVTAIQGEGYTDSDLPSIAYTLQVGREAMEERLAFIAASVKELEDKLQAFTEGTDTAGEFYQGNVKQKQGNLAYFMTDEDLQEIVEKWTQRKQYSKLLELWVNGFRYDWNKLYQDHKPGKISLPAYPFAKERYWIPGADNKSSGDGKDSFTSKDRVRNRSEAEKADMETGSFEPARSDQLAYLIQSVQEILGLPLDFAVDPQTQLLEYGMNSVSGIQLLAKIKQGLGIELDGRRFFSVFTLQEIISQLSLAGPAADQESNSPLPWELDKTLPDNTLLLSPAAPFRHNVLPEKVFLTGVTGLLGAFLCHEIVQQTSATVFCLVRAESEAAGLKRIQDNLKKYKLWKGNYKSRIIPVLGDITKAQLGIEKTLYNELSRSIERIYHCAALPNHILNYQSLKKPNVNGTLSIIEFAGNGVVKPIYFSSTVAVCARMDGGTVLSPHQSETLLEYGKNLSGGYAQSKWVSEHHLMQAQERGIPVAIFRCGEITGASQTGCGIAGDMMHNFLKIFSEVNVIPEWEDGVLDIVPVDYVCKAILAVSQRQTCYNKIYHLNHSQPIPVQAFFAFLQKKNPLLLKVPFETWADSCLKYIDGLPESPVKTIMEGFFAKMDSGHRGFEYYFRDMGLSSENIQGALQHSKVDFPRMDDPWWEKCRKQLALFNWEGN